MVVTPIMAKHAGPIIGIVIVASKVTCSVMRALYPINKLRLADELKGGAAAKTTNNIMESSANPSNRHMDIRIKQVTGMKPNTRPSNVSVFRRSVNSVKTIRISRRAIASFVMTTTTLRGWPDCLSPMVYGRQP